MTAKDLYEFCEHVGVANKTIKIVVTGKGTADIEHYLSVYDIFNDSDCEMLIKIQADLNNEQK